MLDSIRKKKDNVIYSFIIILVAIVMAFFGLGKFGDDRAGGGTAAVVNGESISRREFQQELEMKMMQYQQLLGQNYDEKFLMALQVPQRTLEELVQYKLLAQQAKRLNIIVPDAELAEHIRSLPYYQKDGKFDYETYKKMPNPGVEESRRRERLQLSKFQNYLVERIKLTPAAARSAYELKETKVDLEFAKIDFAAMAASQKPKPGEVDAFLKTAPEKEIQDYYDSHKKDFTQKAEVKLRQIRVAIPYQAKDAQKKEARTKIDAIAKEVTADNFTKVAKEKSDDEYAKKGGEVGWVQRGTLEPTLEKAIDNLNPGMVSAPIETPFGYFIVQAVEKKAEVVTPVADVKRKIAETLVAEKSKKTFIDEKRAEWDKLLAEGKSLEPELKKSKIEIKKTGPFAITQGTIPNIGAAEPIVDAVFALTPKEPVAKKLYQFGDAYYYVKLKSVERPKPEEFAKNHEAVERSVETALQSELMQKWVANLQKTATIKTEIKF